jgi:hypothetical protein
MYVWKKSTMKDAINKKSILWTQKGVVSGVGRLPGMGMKEYMPFTAHRMVLGRKEEV